MAQITCLVCSGRGIVLAHGLVDGSVDVGIDGLAALCRVRLNDLFFAFRHYKIDAVVVIFHIFIYGLLLGLACWGHITDLLATTYHGSTNKYLRKYTNCTYLHRYIWRFCQLIYLPKYVTMSVQNKTAAVVRSWRSSQPEQVTVPPTQRKNSAPQGEVYPIFEGFASPPCGRILRFLVVFRRTV